MKSKMKLIHFVAVLGCLSVKTIGQDTPQTLSNFVASSTATSIHLTWTQPQSDLVDSYEINYTYTINQCGSDRGAFPPVIISLSNGTQRSYTIINSPTTPVEEDSKYTIMLTTISNGTRSSSASNSTTTLKAAPGPPSSLIASSISISSITIQWDPVPCQDQNRPFSNYRVTYYPSSDPNAGDVMIVGENDRVFSLTPLPPRTNYTFEVQALDLRNLIPGIPANLIVSTSEPSSLGFLLDGVLYLNNSVVTVTDIGSSFFMSALFCLTPSLECCSESETPNAASVTREWYLPNSRPVSSAGTVFSRGQVSSAVSLYRSGSTSLSGVFRCEIPDASGTSQNIYVGIYPQEDGSPSIKSLLFDRNSTTLTCTSTGGPPTTVTWRKDGLPINVTVYEQSQRLVDAEEATYENIIFNDDIANFVGTFTCEVSNVRGRVQETVELNGVSIIRDQFNVGDNATASCISDNQATRMEWLNNGMVIETAMSTQQLDLEFSPVNDSIHNQVYICRVTRGDDVQEQNFTVRVDVPLGAISTTVSRSGAARAGMIFNLTCTVFKTVDGLINSPTATWTTGGVAVSNGTNIAVLTMVVNAYAVSTLTFDPLRASHQGNYRCGGSLASPALGMERTDFTSEQLSVQISTPDVVITVPPGPLFAGSIDPLTLICNISINPATDITITAATVDVSWRDSVGTLSNGSSRVTISPLSGSGLSYTSTLTVSPPSTADSTFTCTVVVRPPPREQSFVIQSENGESRNDITIEAPSPPVVSITTSSSSVVAGQPLTLTCFVTLQEGIRGTPVLTWTREGFDNLPSEAASAPPLLTFPTLRTSHGGQYTCTARLSIPEAGVDVPGTMSANISIQIPQPSVTISGSPRNMTFLPGLVETFTCVVEVHPAVDTPVMVRGNWERNGTLLRHSGSGRISVADEFVAVVASPNRYQITIDFNPMTFDDNGVYRCLATVAPQNSEFVSEHAILASSQRTVYVQELPPPSVTIASRRPSADGCGEARILNCTTELVDGFITAPSISWIAPGGTPVSTDQNANPRLNSQTKQLILSSISSANHGVYMCRLGVGISFEAFTGVDVDAELPGIPQNLVCAESSSPTDLTFSWDSPTSRRNEIVGYRVDVKGLAHMDGTREVIQFNVTTLITPMMQATLTQGLAAEIPYNITVKALNVAGCGKLEQVYCFTQEGRELPIPENVKIIRSNTTSIEISWKQFTLVELEALANYTVTYSASMSNEGQTTNIIHVPWTEDGITITNLIPGTRYDITVGITTLSGMSAQVQTSGSTRSLPSQMNSLPIIIGVVVALAIVLIMILTVIIFMVVLVTRRRRATLKLEKTRMLRAFEQPADIMLTSKEKNAMDEEEEEEVTTLNELQEKPLPASTGECELVQTPVHVPTTFTAPKEEPTDTENSMVQVNGNG